MTANDIVRFYQPGIISNTIENDYYHDSSMIYPKVPVRVLIAGPSGSGKTSLIRHIVGEDIDNQSIFYLYFDAFSYYTSTAPLFPSSHSMPYSRLTSFNDFVRRFGRVENGVVSPRFEDMGRYHNVIVFDDLPYNENNRLFPIIKDFLSKSRHYNLSCFLCVHDLRTLPVDIKNLVDTLIMTHNSIGNNVATIQNMTGVNRQTIESNRDADYNIFYNNRENNRPTMASISISRNRNFDRTYADFVDGNYYN